MYKTIIKFEYMLKPVIVIRYWSTLFRDHTLLVSQDYEFNTDRVCNVHIENNFNYLNQEIL